MWEVTAVGALAIAAAVLAVGPLLESVARRDPLVLRAAVTVLALAFAGAQVPALRATMGVRRSQDAVARNDRLDALQRADAALKTEPWATTPHRQRARVLEHENRLRAAAAEAWEAERRQPEDWRAPYARARIAAERGRAEDALAALRRARSLRPHAPIFRSPPPPVLNP